MDGSYLYHGIKNYGAEIGQPTFHIDFQKFVTQIAKGRPLVRAIYYCSMRVPPDSEQVKFLAYIRKCGIQVVEKPLKEKFDPRTQQLKQYEKGVDVALVTDLIGLAWDGVYDIGVLVSGDADYTEAVKKLVGKGRSVELVSWKRSCSKELSQAALNTRFIDEFA